MKNLWDDRKSITLTRIVVALAIAGSIIMTVCGPVLLGMGYLCAVLALVMLCTLYQFLRRIEQGEIFVARNVAALRSISWCCVGAAFI